MTGRSRVRRLSPQPHDRQGARAATLTPGPSPAGAGEGGQFTLSIGRAEFLTLSLWERAGVRAPYKPASTSRSFCAISSMCCFSAISGGAMISESPVLLRCSARS